MFLYLLGLLAAGIFGFGLGRIRREVEREYSEAEETVTEDKVGSPVSGNISVYREGGGILVVIHPSADSLFAPCAGKISYLYPLGNGMKFKTQFGAELDIRVGDREDELHGCYYRPRVVQNEVVHKGKLLLEFDSKGLEAEGVTADVLIKFENCEDGEDVFVTAENDVKIGEEILHFVDFKL